MKYFLTKINFFLILFLIFLTLNAKQIDAKKYYDIENDGYFKTAIQTDYGIVATDNYNSQLYIIKNGIIKIIHSSPGCGNYFTLSLDKRFLGFKNIREDDAMQAPFIYDLKLQKAIQIGEFVSSCGEVSFSSNGSIGYNYGQDYIVVSPNGEKNVFNLGVHSNIAPISPDGNSVAFTNYDGDLFIFDLKNSKKHQITFGKEYYYPKWSYDSQKISFLSLSGSLCVYDIIAKQIFKNIALASSLSWSYDSKKIVFDKVSNRESSSISSDLYLINFDGTDKTKLFIDKNKFKMDPSFTKNGDIIFHTYDKKGIFKAKISNRKITLQEKLYTDDNNQLKIKFYNICFPDKLTKNITVPYVHQVYDTDSYSHRYGCCSSTTCAMALSYYKKHPYWKSSTNNWAKYIYTKYRYKGNDFDIPYSGGNGTGGGDGYMWHDNGNGGSSPSSNQKYYLRNNGLTSVQYWSNFWNKISADINNNHPHPVCVLLSSSGHLILAKGIFDVDNKVLIFNDPYGDKNTSGYPSNDGADVKYDWPGENTGLENLVQVAWSTSAIGSFEDSPTTEVDDLQFAFDGYDSYSSENVGFYLHTDSPSSMQYFRGETGGINDNFWWTGSVSGSSITCYGVWRPNISENGSYKISVYIPQTDNMTSTAIYKIHSSNGSDTEVPINQQDNSNKWVELGLFEFNSDNNGYVLLGDAIGDKYGFFEKDSKSSYRIVYDKVKFEYIENPSLHFTSSPVTEIIEDDGYIYDAQTNFDESQVTYFIEEAPQWLSLNPDNGKLSGNPNNSNVGNTQNVKIKASALNGEICFQEFIISVANKIPIFTSYPQIYSICIGEDYSYNAQTDDEGYGNTNYTITNAPTWLDWNVSTGVISGTTAFSEEGEYTINFDDGNNGIVSQVVPFRVIPENREVIYQNNFENGNGNLVALSGWEYGIDNTANAKTGTNIWGTVLNNNYGNTVDYKLDLSDITLLSNSFLEFWHWYDIEGSKSKDKLTPKNPKMETFFDGGNVKISTDNGETFSIITPDGEYPGIINDQYSNPLGGEVGFGGSLTAWTKVVFDLSSYIGNIILRWEFGSDGATVKQGWYIDNVYIEGDKDTSIINPNNFPKKYILNQNYPNPFNPITTIRYALPKKSMVKLIVFNSLGKEIVNIENGIQDLGWHNVTFDGSRYSSGIYYYNLIVDGKIFVSKKMILMK